MVRMNRRTLIGMLGAALLPVGGCAGFLSCTRSRCPHDPAISDRDGPLTIDVHVHVFNGADLQVAEFLSQVTTRSKESELGVFVDALGDVLQFLAWQVAPGAQEEFTALAGYERLLAGCDRGGHAALFKKAQQDDYDRGRRQLQDAVNASQQRFGVPVQPRGRFSAAFLRGVHAEIRDMPPLRPDWRQRRVSGPRVAPAEADLQITQGRTSARSYIDFALHFFAHRYANALDYLETYSVPSSRKIDLLVSSLVDFDWWLARGRPTKVSLADQVALMERVSVLTQGRIHGFVPFCPFRELMTARSGPGESLALVQDAVENRGFLGVKLYPPMGFAAYSNGPLRVWQGKPTLPEAAQDPGFGERLDRALSTLFEWCVAQQVPLMAHANRSNGPYTEFEDLAGAPYWSQALAKFRGLPVSFGHFGDTDTADHQGERAKAFMALMSETTGTPGARAYADSAFFADALTQPDKLRDTMLELYRSAPGRLLPERLMYGSDWEMLTTQVDADRYFDRFGSVFRQIDDALPGARPRGLRPSDAFFGWNAVSYLGLAAGTRSRARLEKFYRKHGLPAPDWMIKVDRGH